MDPHCLSWRLLKHFSRREKQTTFDAIGELRDKINTHIEQTNNVVVRHDKTQFKPRHQLSLAKA